MTKAIVPDFSERLSTAAKAKQALLERARANAPANDPDFARRQAERREIALAREARIAERKAAKLAEEQRKLEEAAAAEAARIAALKAEEEARLAAELERKAQEAAAEAARKALRDIRYANRKGRLKGKKR